MKTFFFLILFSLLMPGYADGQAAHPIDSIPAEKKVLLRSLGKNLSLPVLCKFSIEVALKELVKNVGRDSAERKRNEDLLRTIMNEINGDDCADYVLAYYSGKLTLLDLEEIDRTFKTDAGKKFVKETGDRMAHLDPRVSSLPGKQVIAFNSALLENRSYVKLTDYMRSQESADDLMMAVMSYIFELAGM